MESEILDQPETILTDEMILSMSNLEEIYVHVIINVINIGRRNKFDRFLKK